MNLNRIRKSVLLVRLRLEADAPALDGDREVYAVAARARLERLGLLRDHPVEAPEREVFRRLAAASPRLDQSLVDSADGRHILARVGADESARGRRLGHRGLRVPTRGRAVAAPLFALLHRSTPELHEGGVARGERVVVVALREAERAVVREPLD